MLKSLTTQIVLSRRRPTGHVFRTRYTSFFSKQKTPTNELKALALGLAYTYSQDNKGKKASFFIITFNVMWLPYVLLLVTFVQEGPNGVLFQATGLLAAHMYDFLTRIWPTFGPNRSGRSLVLTPAVVRRWFGGARPIQNRGFGTSYSAPVPGSRTTATGDTGFSSSFQNTWGNRGAGRRLGGT